MQLHIDGNYYLKSDQYNFILAKYKGTYTDKKGNEVEMWDNISYHQRPEQALDSFVNDVVRNGDYSALSELSADIKRLRRVFEDAFKKEGEI